jgi:peptidoglycan-associated lipoprotein
MRRVAWVSVVLAIALSAPMIFTSGCHKQPKVQDVVKARAGEPKPEKGQAAQAPKIRLTASPNPIEIGQTTTLSWDSLDAAEVKIDNGIGTVEASGSRTLSPRTSTTYKATANGSDGNRATAEVRITVVPPKTGGNPPPPPPPPPLDTLPIKDAYFDYDQYNIRGDARTVLIDDAHLLTQYPKLRITVEGHCDERGSEKYNLALGDRRAIAVKDFLTAQGIDGSRIETISYGKERNFCEERNEGCWQSNRRAHFAFR